MSYCPKCGTGVSADARSCPSCGYYLHVTPAAGGRSDLPPIAAAPAPPEWPQTNAYAWSDGFDARTAQPDPRPYRAAATASPGLFLHPDERIEREVWFSPKVLMPHLRSLVVLTNQRVVIRHPHTILGFVPLGYWETSARRSSVSTIGAGTRVRTERLLFGVAAGLYGLFQFFSSFGGYVGSWVVLMALATLGVAGYLLATARVTGLIVYADGESFAAAARGSELVAVEQTAQEMIRSMLEHQG
ncbi:MAG: zinc ribbon domain-containing protein [Propionicimonas sp.]